MAITITDPETERLARQLADATGQSVDEAIAEALRGRLAEARNVPMGQSAIDIIHEIQERVARLPVLDDRSADEILGYDEHGLPT